MENGFQQLPATVEDGAPEAREQKEHHRAREFHGQPISNPEPIGGPQNHPMHRVLNANWSVTLGSPVLYRDSPDSATKSETGV